METLQNKIDQLLKRSLRDGGTDLETLANGHVCGHVISSEFKGMSYEDRRRRIREILDQTLSQDELVLISTLLTYTPEEWTFAPESN